MASLLCKKAAIITGASSGIGEAIALMFASRGAKVTLCGRDKDRLMTVFDKAVKMCGGDTDKVLRVDGDLNDRDVRRQVISQTVDKFGRLDILVANAAATRSKQSVMTATEETYDTIMDTNLKSVFFLIQDAVPHLEKHAGNIVNISSAITYTVCPATTIYALSKIGLDHLTKCLAFDLGPKGIRVNVINPGFISTLILRHHGEKTPLVNSSIQSADSIKQILKDKILTMEDVTEAVAFLASDAAGFITGESIKIDGGRSFVGPPLWRPSKTD